MKRTGQRFQTKQDALQAQAEAIAHLDPRVCWIEKCNGFYDLYAIVDEGEELAGFYSRPVEGLDRYELDGDEMRNNGPDGYGDYVRADEVMASNRLTHEQALLLSAYTFIQLVPDFNDIQKFIDKEIGRPVKEVEFSDPWAKAALRAKLKDRVKAILPEVKK